MTSKYSIKQRIALGILIIAVPVLILFYGVRYAKKPLLELYQGLNDDTAVTYIGIRIDKKGGEAAFWNSQDKSDIQSMLDVMREAEVRYDRSVSGVLVDPVNYTVTLAQRTENGWTEYGPVTLNTKGYAYQKGKRFLIVHENDRLLQTVSSLVMD